jgi:hypothetical protein
VTYRLYRTKDGWLPVVQPAKQVTPPERYYAGFAARFVVAADEITSVVVDELPSDFHTRRVQRQPPTPAEEARLKEQEAIERALTLDPKALPPDALATLTEALQAFINPTGVTRGQPDPVRLASGGTSPAR